MFKYFPNRSFRNFETWIKKFRVMLARTVLKVSPHSFPMLVGYFTRNVSYFVLLQPLAEKAAWDYTISLSPEEKFELVVINPGFVMGPVLCGVLNTSMEVKYLLAEHFFL